MSTVCIEKGKYIADGLLEKYMLNSGYKISYICEKLGLSLQGFDKKRKGLTPFKVCEVYILVDLLHIPYSDMRKIFN